MKKNLFLIFNLILITKLFCQTSTLITNSTSFGVSVTNARSPLNPSCHTLNATETGALFDGAIYTLCADLCCGAPLSEVTIDIQKEVRLSEFYYGGSFTIRPPATLILQSAPTLFGPWTTMSVTQSLVASGYCKYSLNIPKTSPLELAQAVITDVASYTT